ncbi:MAG: hypothetical protein O6945_01985, partial [Gammaproteobacteria bacterium]|nr:hypothetical protein [Gammaproteobacteria bacterium]
MAKGEAAPVPISNLDEKPGTLGATRGARARPMFKPNVVVRFQYAECVVRKPPILSKQLGKVIVSL